MTFPSLDLLPPASPLMGLLVLLLLLPSESRARAMGQQVSVAGVVRDTAGGPVPDARVDIVHTASRAITDNQGRFEFTVVPGHHVLRVAAIGYASRVIPILADSLSGWRGSVVLARPSPPVILPEITAEAEAEEDYLRRATDAGFLRRQRSGFGVFLTRDEIQSRHPLYTADILRGIPGVTLQFNRAGAGETRVSFARCPDRIAVWLNGSRMRIDSHHEALALIHPKEIAAIEIYRGVAEIPVEFLVDSCAAIVIWTH